MLPDVVRTRVITGSPLAVWGASEFLEWYFPDVGTFEVGIPASSTSGRCTDMLLLINEHLTGLAARESAAVLPGGHDRRPDLDAGLVRLWTMHGWQEASTFTQASVHIAVKAFDGDPQQTHVTCRMFPRDIPVDHPVAACFTEPAADRMLDQLAAVVNGSRRWQRWTTPLDPLVDALVDQGLHIHGERRWIDVGGHDVTRVCRMSGAPDLQALARSLHLPSWISVSPGAIIDTAWTQGATRIELTDE